MAKFLNTEGTSYYLKQLIDSTKQELILISPYLKINNRIKQSLEDKNYQRVPIKVVYGKVDLHPDEDRWLKSMSQIQIGYCKDLHAKCFLNENEAVITSMNLYEFSQLNNHEMGIHVEKRKDSELYKNIYDEAQRLMRISGLQVAPIEKISPERTRYKRKEIFNGYCIRTGVEIPFNIEKPLCIEAFKTWSFFENPDFPENFCHFTGELSHGDTCVSTPILKKNWKKAKELHNL
jgi:hypothetical protein